MIYIISVVFPAIAMLFLEANSNQVTPALFRLIPGFCLAPAIQETPLPPGPELPDLTGLQTEHPLDVNALFVSATSRLSLADSTL